MMCIWIKKSRWLIWMEVVNLEFVNERMTKLPHTGSSMSLCVVIGAYLMLRRNHE